MLLDAPGSPLRLAEVPDPEPGAVGGRAAGAGPAACAAPTCTYVDGELDSGAKLPLVLGHQIVAERLDDGRCVGVPWLGWTRHVRVLPCGRENLCVPRGLPVATATADTPSWLAHERYCFALPRGAAALTPRRSCVRG